MKSIKQIKTTLLAAAALAALTSAATLQAQTVLTASSWVPPTHNLTLATIEWGKQVEQATGGRVKLNMLPKPVTAPPGHYNAVRDGQVDVTFTVMGYTPGRFQLAELAELPFLGDSAVATSIAFERVSKRYPQIRDEYKDVKILALFTHGPGMIFNTKKQINGLADMAGLKFRVGGGMVNEVGKAIGANVTLKPAPESFELLNSGVMDGVFFPAESIRSFRLDKLIKHATTFPGGLYNTAFIFAMNQAKFNALPAADQAAIEKLSGEHVARLFGQSWDRVDREAKAVMQATNIKVTSAPAAFVKDVQEKSAQFEQKWKDAAKAKGIANPDAVLRDFRSEISKL